MKKFVVDIMLGKLARWLRILGYDAIYTQVHHLYVLFQYLENGYIFLTRRRKWQYYRILQNKPIYFVQTNNWTQQLVEVVTKYNLKPYKLFSRCIVCNTLLEKREKNQLEKPIPEYIAHAFFHFKICPKCGRVYWPGTHQQKMRKKLQEIFGEEWFYCNP